MRARVQSLTLETIRKLRVLLAILVRGRWKSDVAGRARRGSPLSPIDAEITLGTYLETESLESSADRNVRGGLLRKRGAAHSS